MWTLLSLEKVRLMNDAFDGKGKPNMVEHLQKNSLPSTLDFAIGAIRPKIFRAKLWASEEQSNSFSRDSRRRYNGLDCDRYLWLGLRVDDGSGYCFSRNDMRTSLGRGG